MVVVSIFRWLLNLRWKEKMKIYRYEADTAFSKTLAAAYQHRRLPPETGMCLGAWLSVSTKFKVKKIQCLLANIM